MDAVPKKLAVSLGDWLPGGGSPQSTQRPVIDAEGICGFVFMVV